MTAPQLHLIVPGPLEQRTGGYLYDARMVAGLRNFGWSVGVLNLEGSFPDGDEVADAALRAALQSLPDGARVVIDGLAMGGLPGPVRAHGGRLRILSLVHHPLADETGLSTEEQTHFAASEREALRPCSGVLVTSGYTAQRLEEYEVAADRIRAVPPGTEPAPAAEGPGAGQPPKLLCVGTVTPRKGHDILVSALARISDLDWTCVCAGSLDRDVGYAGSVFDRVRKAGLADRIEFVGEHATDVLDGLYHTSSIFVLASYYEGYGMALAEALGRGLPVVSTTGGAIPFTVPEECGVLVAPGDDVALSEALRSLLAPAAEVEGGTVPSGARLRAELAAAARRYAAELPDWDESVEAFAEAVLELSPEGPEGTAQGHAAGGAGG